MRVRQHRALQQDRPNTGGTERREQFDAGCALRQIHGRDAPGLSGTGERKGIGRRRSKFAKGPVRMYPWEHTMKATSTGNAGPVHWLPQRLQSGCAQSQQLRQNPAGGALIHEATRRLTTARSRNQTPIFVTQTCATLEFSSECQPRHYRLAPDATAERH